MKLVTSAVSSGRRKALAPVVVANVCAHVRCAAAVVPVHGASVVIFEAIAGSTSF